METNISEEEAKNALNETERQAEELLKDTEQTHKTLKKANKLLDKIKEIPVIGRIADDIAASIELIRDYKDDRYRCVPTRVIVAALAGILYIINPFDLIPDYIPFIGWLDDSFVFMLILKIGLSMELEKYRKWKKAQEGEPVSNKISQESDEMETYSFSFDIEKPKDIDPKELFTEIKKQVKNCSFTDIQGDEKSGTITAPEHPLEPFHCLDKDAITAVIYEYEIDEVSIKIIIRKKKESLVRGLVELGKSETFFNENVQYISRIFLDAIKALESKQVNPIKTDDSNDEDENTSLFVVSAT